MDYLLQDGENLQLGRYQFKCLYTPGHDVGQMVLFEQELGLLVSGDLVASKGTALPWYPHSAGGVEEYLNSLDRVSTLELEQILPAHGSVIGDVSAIDKTKEIINRREKNLLSAINDHPSTFRELDELLWPRTAWQVVPWCSSVTLSHLNKLLREGRVRFELPDIYTVQ